jgi:hypothetical protein
LQYRPPQQNRHFSKRTEKKCQLQVESNNMRRKTSKGSFLLT